MKSEVETFYRAALSGLFFADALENKGRHFGEDADSRWKSFAGHLTVADRIEIMCRNGAERWGAAYSATLAFGHDSTAPDEPFPADWERPDKRDAQKLWDEVITHGKPTPKEALALHFQLCGGKDVQDLESPLPELQASTQLLLGGLSAVYQAALAFLDNASLAWSEQIQVVASAPHERQFAALVAVTLNASNTTRLVDPTDSSASDFGHITHTCLSEDATQEVRQLIKALNLP